MKKIREHKESLSRILQYLLIVYIIATILIKVENIVFSNINITIVFITGIASLLMLYLLSRQILGRSFIALFPIAIIVSEPLYYNQNKIAPLFDFAQLFFIVTSFYFFNEGLIQKNKTLLFFSLANIFISFFITTKFYSFGVPAIVSMLLVFLLHRYWKKFVLFTYTLWIPIIVLLLIHLRIFTFGYSISGVLDIQNWYRQASLAPFFSAWDLLLFNKWHTWWGNRLIISDTQWEILWPIATSLTVLTIILYIFKRIKHRLGLEVLLLYAVIYGIFISTGVSTVRYFTIYLPFLYIIAFYLIKELLVWVSITIPSKRKIVKEKY